MAFDYECDKMLPNLILSFLLLKVIETGLGERARNVQFFSQIRTSLLFQKQGFGTKFGQGLFPKHFGNMLVTSTVRDTLPTPD